MFKTYFIDVVKNHYFDLAGKADRKQFWLYFLFQFLFCFVLGFILGFVLGKIGILVSFLVGLALLLPMIGIGTRRLRDAGFPPALGWLFAAGVVSSLLSLIGIPLLPALCSLAYLVALILCIFPTKQ